MESNFQRELIPCTFSSPQLHLQLIVQTNENNSSYTAVFPMYDNKYLFDQFRQKQQQQHKKLLRYPRIKIHLRLRDGPKIKP